MLAMLKQETFSKDMLHIECVFVENIFSFFVCKSTHLHDPVVPGGTV